MKKLLLLFLIIFQAAFCFSQFSFKTLIREGADSSVSLAVFNHPEMQKPEMVLQQLNAAGTATAYKLLYTFTDEKGILHRQYQQYYNGLKVREAVYAVHLREGGIYMLNGRYVAILPNNLVATISEQVAKNIAATYVAGKVKQAAPSLTTVERIISPNDFDKKAPFQLAYAIGTTNPLYETVYVGAQTGQVLSHSSSICTTNANGTGDTHYSGNRNIVTDQVANPVAPNLFRLRENRNGVAIAVRNMAAEANWENVGAATDFFDNDNNWTQAEHGNDDVAVDVNWAMENILDYWLTQRGGNSYDNAGSAVNAYVHDNFPPRIGQDNAVWNGNNFTLNFADGNFLGSETSLDICAHEFGHGVCQFTAHLPGGTTGEGSALNEGFSDIWGEAVERYSNSGKPQWLHRSDIVGFFNTCVRNLQNPNDPAAWEGQHPNTYQGNFWSFNGEPHFNSTVLSHWFFLISDGGNGTNDIGNVFNFQGLGFTTASTIAYETEKYLSSGSDYANARLVSIQRTAALYGANSCEVRTVENAWFAVGVGPASATQPVFTSNISSPTQTCGSTIVAINAVPPGSAVSGWVSDNSAIAQVLTFSGLSANILLKGNGSATLTATVVPPANSCYGAYTVTKLVNSAQEFGGGESITDNVSGSATWFCIGSYITASAPAYNGATSYQWTPSSNISLTSANGTANPSINGQSTSGGTGSLTVNITTYCGNQTLTKPYYIGTQFGAAKAPFEVTHLDCRTGVVTVQADAYQTTTNYYWTVVEYAQNNTVLASASYTTTNNVQNHTLNLNTDHGTVCLRINVGGCGISEQRCVNFSVPCRNVRIAYSSTGITVATEDVQQDKTTVLVYPNPVKDLLNLQLPRAWNGKSVIEVSDASGRQVLSRTAYTIKGNLIQLPVRLVSGYYFIKVIHDNKVATAKFMKE